MVDKSLSYMNVFILNECIRVLLTLCVRCSAMFVGKLVSELTVSFSFYLWLRSGNDLISSLLLPLLSSPLSVLSLTCYVRLSARNASLLKVKRTYCNTSDTSVQSHRSRLVCGLNWMMACAIGSTILYSSIPPFNASLYKAISSRKNSREYIPLISFSTSSLTLFLWKLSWWIRSTSLFC